MSHTVTSVDLIRLKWADWRPEQSFWAQPYVGEDALSETGSWPTLGTYKWLGGRWRSWCQEIHWKRSHM